MAYEMAFKGVFRYPSEQIASEALHQLRAYEQLEESVVQEDALVQDSQSIRVECFTSAPASMWESTCGAIETLAEHATSGHVNAQYDGGDGDESILRIRYLAGGDEQELDEPFPDGIEPEPSTGA